MPASPFRALWCVFGTLAIFALLNLAFDGFPHPFIEREPTFRYAIGFVEPDGKPIDHERRYRDWHQDEFGVPAPTGSKSFKAKEFAVDLLLALSVSGGEAWRVGRVSTKRG